MIRELLADPPRSERYRRQEASVPRSTYQAIRHRAFANGWVRERYLPDPTLVGETQVRHECSLPTTEERARATEVGLTAASFA